MTFADWFFQVALSGLVATFAAAGIAGWLAVWGVRRTIEHDRELAAEALFAADCRSVIDRADAMRRLLMGTSDELTTTMLLWDLNLALSHLARRALGRSEANLQKLVAEMYHWPPPETQFLNGLLTSISEVLNWRVSVPEYFATLPENELQAIVSALREGDVLGLGVPTARQTVTSRTSRWRGRGSR